MRRDNNANGKSLRLWNARTAWSPSLELKAIGDLNGTDTVATCSSLLAGTVVGVMYINAAISILAVIALVVNEAVSTATKFLWMALPIARNKERELTKGT